MTKCKAILVTRSDKEGEQCDSQAFGESEFCWVHDLAITNGMRTEKDVREGKGKRDHRRQYYTTHKLAGLCIDCNEPCLSDNLRCQKHRDKANRRRRERR
jgi:hypothetical protein